MSDDGAGAAEAGVRAGGSGLQARDVTLLGTRLLVAFIFLSHGVPKALDPAMAAETFTQIGLEGWLGPVVGFVETVAGALLALGLFHRFAVLALAAVIIGALVVVQFPAGMQTGLERDLLILMALFALRLHGAGRLSVEGLRSAAPA